MDTKATGKLIVVELIGFLAVIAIVWLNELLDLPNLCFNAKPTPVNLAECFIETVLIATLGFVVIQWSSRHLRKLRYLEGFLHVCNYCRRVYVKGKWISIYTYLAEYDEEETCHGRCPDCAEQMEKIAQAGAEKIHITPSQKEDKI